MKTGPVNCRTLIAALNTPMPINAWRQPASATDRSDRGLATSLEGAASCSEEFAAGIESLVPFEPQVAWRSYARRRRPLCRRLLLGVQKEVRCGQLMRIPIVEHDGVSAGVDHGVAMIELHFGSVMVRRLPPIVRIHD